MAPPADRMAQGRATRHETSGYRSGSPASRAVSSVLAALVMLLVALAAFLIQTQVLAPERENRPLATFDVAAGNREATQRKDTAKASAQKRPTPERKQTTTSEVARAPVPTPKPTKAEEPAFTFLKMSTRDFAAADIGAMKPQPGGAASGGGGNDKGTYGPGEGPGGAVLYNADWFRRPTDAQLGGYLPASRPNAGWGMIACQTIENYRVENCQILGESPQGSGFGRAVLNAAWQFQVIPPRVNGKQQIGTWVRIRIDYGTRPPPPSDG